jgi:hypothetical protein
MAGQDQYEVDLPATSTVTAVVLQARVRDRYGEQLNNVTVEFWLEGDGTLEPAQEVRQLSLVTAEDGSAFVTWWDYPRYQPRQALRGTVMALCKVEGSRLTLSPLHRVESQS